MADSSDRRSHDSYSAAAALRIGGDIASVQFTIAHFCDMVDAIGRLGMIPLAIPFFGPQFRPDECNR
jgi:hypothetical protein